MSERGLYYKRLNQFARRYLVKAGQRYTKAEADFFPALHLDIQREVAELLLLHDKLVIHVHGENVPLAVLLTAFGKTGVEALLEQRAIEFLLWTPFVSYNVTDIEGIHPLQSGTYTQDVFVDPFSSAEAGLGWWTASKSWTRKERRSFLRRVARRCRVPDAATGANAAKFGIEGYEADLFRDFGLAHNLPVTRLAEPDRALLCTLASQQAELAVAAKFGYDFCQLPGLAKLGAVQLDRLHDVAAVRTFSEEVFEVEGLPNFRALIGDGLLDIERVPTFRASQDSKKYRDWLSTVSEDCDLTDATRTYIASIANARGMLDTVGGKFVKTLVLTSLSTTIGLAAGGVVGGVAGAFVGATGADLVLNALDSYVLDGVLRGWHPRHYFDRAIRPLIEDEPADQT